MKIAMVCLNLGWQTGGPRLIFSFAQALKRAKQEVVLYAPDYDPTTYPDLSAGLDIRRVEPPLPILWQYKSAGLLGRIVEKFQHERAIRAVARKIADTMDRDFDIVNCHDYAYKILPRYLSRNSSAHVIWTMNEPPYMYLPKKNPIYDVLSRLFNVWKDVSERSMFALVRAVVVFVHRNKHWIEARGPQATIIWPGIEFEKFYAPVRKLSSPKKSFVLLGVGAFNRYRRFEIIVAAAAILRSRGYDARARIICKDIWNARADKEELLSKVNELSMEPYAQLQFEGETEEGLKEAYRTSDIFVAATHLGPPRNGFSWGLALFESIAAGMPNIITNKNDVQEALRDGETALFVDPLNPAQVADAAERLTQDPALYNRIARAGQDFVRKELSWDAYAKKFLDLCVTKNTR